MDARPQRPLRTMRTFNDENVHPNMPLPKTIHQRNKSSPALANIGAGALKTAAKRTAFGDVSNIVATQKTAKDDLSSLTKPGIYNSIKLQPVFQDKKAAAFLRPAQRPLSVSNLKNLLSGPVEHGPTVESHIKPQPNESSTTHSVANTRRTLTKRATTVFKDLHLDTVQEHESTEPEKREQPQFARPSADLVSVEVAIPSSKSNLHLPPPLHEPVVEPVKSVDPPASEVQHSEPLTSIPVETQAELDNPVTTEVKQIIQPVEPWLPAPLPNHDTKPAVVPVSAPAEIEPTAAELPLVNLADFEAKPLPPPHQTLLQQPLGPVDPNVIQLPARAEPEEYWEEYEEDGYEDDAYVTARSFRSKGDNTTGGVTTVLVPRINLKVRKEIEAATKLLEATRTHEEVEDEAYDTSMVAQYGDEIFEYMRRLEVKMSPNPHYMDNQHEIQWSMRSVLMDWLVQVHHRFNLLPETLFLCVNYIDRFLSSKVVSLGKLQLVGATAIFIAAKYEEINCPSVQEIVYMVDGGYSIDEILKAERFMLTMLQFELGWPGPMSFLRRISKADDYDLETRTLAKYFLEVTLMDERFIASPPSFTAAASHCLARLMLRKGSWSPHHVYYSGYTYSQLKPLVQLLLDCCEEPRKHHSAVYNKYCDKRYKRAAAFVENEIARGFMLQQQSPMGTSYLQSTTYSYYAETQYLGF